MGQMPAENNSVYGAQIQNNPQNHVLLSTREFYQMSQASFVGIMSTTPIYNHYARVHRLVNLSLHTQRMEKRTVRKQRRRKDEVWKLCAPAPLRVPRPGLSVGKVTQCLSHDPCEEAFLLLGPSLEMGMSPKTPGNGRPTHPRITAWPTLNMWWCF